MVQHVFKIRVSNAMQALLLSQCMATENRMVNEVDKLDFIEFMCVNDGEHGLLCVLYGPVGIVVKAQSSG